MTDAVDAIVALRAASQRRVFLNKLVAGLVADISDVTTTVPFVPVTGAWPSSMLAGQRLTLFITSTEDSDRYEIAVVTAIVGGALTLERGAEGTAALSWTAVDTLLVADITANALNRAAQTDEPTVFSQPVAFETGAAFAGTVDFGGPVVLGPGVTLNAVGASATLVSTKPLAITSPELTLNGLGVPDTPATVEGGLLAVRDGEIVGEPRTFYLGAFLLAPEQIGAPLPAGTAYYDLTSSAMKVWTGTRWTSAHALAIGAGSIFVYALTAGDTTVDLATADDNGNTYAAVSGYFADVFKNGLLLTPVVGGSGDYILNSTTGLITLTTPALAGDVILVRAVIAPSTLAPAMAVARALVLLAPNGVRTAYPLEVEAGGGGTVGVDPPSEDDVYIYVDGVRQQPGVDYTVTAGVLTFGSPPAADATLWGQVSVAGVGP